MILYSVSRCCGIASLWMIRYCKIAACRLIYILATALGCVLAGNLLTVSRALHVNRPSRQLAQQNQLPRTPPSVLILPSAPVNASAPSPRRDSGARASAQQHTARQTRQLMDVQATSVSSQAVPDVQHVAPKRYLARRSQIVGGVFLHQTRKRGDLSCSPKFSRKLSHACLYSQATGKIQRGLHCL